MKKIIKAIKKNKKEAFIILGLFFLAFFLRIYKLPAFLSYHQDQVRDLLFIKSHFDKKTIFLLGPKASIGNFYLPPFWYYLMALSY